MPEFDLFREIFCRRGKPRERRRPAGPALVTDDSTRPAGRQRSQERNASLGWSQAFGLRDSPQA